MTDKSIWSANYCTKQQCCFCLSIFEPVVELQTEKDFFGVFFSVMRADLYFSQIRSCTFVFYVRSSRLASFTAEFFFTGVFVGQVKSTAVSPE